MQPYGTANSSITSYKNHLSTSTPAPSRCVFGGEGTLLRLTPQLLLLCPTTTIVPLCVQGVKVYFIDLFDNDASVVTAMKAAGLVPVCYFRYALQRAVCAYMMHTHLCCASTHTRTLPCCTGVVQHPVRELAAGRKQLHNCCQGQRPGWLAGRKLGRHSQHSRQKHHDGGRSGLSGRSHAAHRQHLVPLNAQHSYHDSVVSALLFLLLHMTDECMATRQRAKHSRLHMAACLPTEIGPAAASALLHASTADCLVQAERIPGKHGLLQTYTCCSCRGRPGTQGGAA